MADEKAKIVTDATGSSSGPAPAQPEVDAQVPSRSSPLPRLQPRIRPKLPHRRLQHRTRAADAPKEQKAASVSVFNFSEIMAEKKATERAAAQQEQRPRTKGLPLRRPRRTGRSRKSPKSKNRHRSAGADRPRPTSTRLPLPHRKKRPARRIRQYRNLHSRENGKGRSLRKTEKAPRSQSR